MSEIDRIGQELLDRSAPDLWSLVDGTLTFSSYGVDYKAVDCSDLIRMILWVTKISLSGKSSQVEFDEQRRILKWAFHVLIKSPINMGKNADSPDFRILVDLFASCALFDTGTLAAEQAFGPSNASKIAFMAPALALYTSYPTLEALLKKHCSKYVSVSGEVLISFERSGGQPYKVGKHCSSIRDLLHLLYKKSDDHLRARLDFFESIFAGLKISDDGLFGQIYSWRNSLLHGEAEHRIARVLMTALIVVLGLSLYEGIFEEMADYARRGLQLGNRQSRLSHYP